MSYSQTTKLFEELVIGLIAGLIGGSVGTVYLIFRKGWVQAMIMESFQTYVNTFVAELQQKPDIIKPYLTILVNQLQDKQLVESITKPILGSIFATLQQAGPGQEGDPFSGVPKKWRWLVEIGMNLFGPQLKEALGGAAPAAKNVLGLPG
ncbi:MAG: hypothetical protein OK436_03140 [Thaumarchaeota archaeon]|nr:hypothetical protein [Nitrososphaerota archaeon]